MKRLILLLLLLLPMWVGAQVSKIGPRPVDTLPALPCKATDFVQLKGSPYTTSVCQNGAWVAWGGGGSGTPGGSTTQVQYNNSGAFGGISGATSDGTTLTLVAPVLGDAAATSLTASGEVAAGSVTTPNLTATGGSISATTIRVPDSSSLPGSSGSAGEIVNKSSTNAALYKGDGSAGWLQVWDGATIAPGTNLRHTVNAQTGTTYTFVDNATVDESLSDRGKLVTFTNASAIAVTLPQAGASSKFISGWYVDVQNRGAGTATITPTTSTIDGAATLAITTGQGARIFSDGTNYFTQRGVGGGGSTTASGVRAMVGAEQTVTASSTTNILYSLESYDNDTYHSTSSNTDRFVCTTAGLYSVSTSVSVAPGTATTSLQLAIKKYNSSDVLQGVLTSTYAAGDTNYYYMSVAGSDRCSVGDYFIATLYNYSGDNRTLQIDGAFTGATPGSFSMTRIGN